MPSPAPLARLALIALAAAWAGSRTGGAEAQEVPSRQVTLFGILATPGSTTVDPKLKSIAPQLRSLMPNHGFTLIKSESRRLTNGGAITLDLGPSGGDLTAGVTLMQPQDPNGKVQFRFGMSSAGLEQAATIVTVPPNQFTFGDRTLSNGSRLLIGLGAR